MAFPGNDSSFHLSAHLQYRKKLNGNHQKPPNQRDLEVVIKRPNFCLNTWSYQHYSKWRLSSDWLVFSFFFTPSMIKIHPCSPYNWRGNMHEDNKLGRKGFKVFKSKWKLSQLLIWKYSVGPYAIIINVVFPSFCSILEQNNLCRPREQGEIVQKKRASKSQR